MKKLILPLVIGLVVLSGCARHYVMKLTNGRQITTASKPQLKGAMFVYKDASGRENYVPQSRVREIEPESMAREEKPKFKPTPVK